MFEGLDRRAGEWGNRPSLVAACAMVVLLLATSVLAVRADAELVIGGVVVDADDAEGLVTATTALADGLASTVVVVSAGPETTTTTVGALGFGIDLATTIANATSDEGRLAARLSALRGSRETVTPVLVERDAGGSARIASLLSPRAADATLTTSVDGPVQIDDVLTPSVEGQLVNADTVRDAAMAAISVRLAGQATAAEIVIELPAPDRVPAALTTSDLMPAAERLVAVADDTVTIRDPSGELATFAGSDLLGWVTLEVQRDSSAAQVIIAIDEVTFPHAVRAEIGARDVAALDAKILVDQQVLAPPRRSDQEDPERFGGTVSVEPGRSGRAVDLDATIAAVFANAGAGPDRVNAVVVDVTPTLTTSGAEQSGVTAPISSFTTFHASGQSRVTNIQTMAKFVDGATILPGATFELNHYVGQRTRAKGYVGGGAISNGEFIESVGGGVSQFATTFFNAAWFSGVAIEQYKAHSFYISRYPAGREATVDFPTVNLEIHNDTPHAIVVKTSFTSTSITVTFWSSPHWTVETITGARRSTSAGFNINVTRVRTAPGGEPERRTFTTVYKLQ